MRSPAKFVAVLFLASSLQLACSSDTHVVVARAPGFDLGTASVSVFGVFSDGRWNPGAWDKIVPRLTSIGGAKCEPGFGDALRAADRELFAALDRDARSNGVTDEMISKIAPSAKGELVVVLEVWGGLGTIPSNAAPTSEPTSGGAGAGGAGMTGPGVGGAGMGGAGMGGMRPGGAGAPGGGYGLTRTKQQDELKMLARVFYPETHEWVGAVELRYSGSDANEAVARFDASLGELLPGAHCSGWTWKAAGAAPSTSSSTSSSSSSSSPTSSTASPVSSPSVMPSTSASAPSP